MKVIEKGNIAKWGKKVKCKGCQAILEVEWEDLEYIVEDSDVMSQQYSEEITGKYQTFCPECGQQIKIKYQEVPPNIEKLIRDKL